MRPTRGPHGADSTQVGPMWATWTLLSWKTIERVNRSHTDSPWNTTVISIIVQPLLDQIHFIRGPIRSVKCLNALYKYIEHKTDVTWIQIVKFFTVISKTLWRCECCFTRIDCTYKVEMHHFSPHNSAVVRFSANYLQFYPNRVYLIILEYIKAVSTNISFYLTTVWYICPHIAYIQHKVYICSAWCFRYFTDPFIFMWSIYPYIEQLLHWQGIHLIVPIYVK